MGTTCPALKNHLSKGLLEKYPTYIVNLMGLGDTALKSNQSTNET